MTDESKTPSPCAARHTPTPEGYVEWHFWAAKRSRTEHQVRCPDCGLWAIWVPGPALVDSTQRWLTSEALDAVWALGYCADGIGPKFRSRLTDRVAWLAEILASKDLIEPAELLERWRRKVARDQDNAHEEPNPPRGGWRRTYGIHHRPRARKRVPK